MFVFGSAARTNFLLPPFDQHEVTSRINMNLIGNINFELFLCTFSIRTLLFNLMGEYFLLFSFSPDTAFHPNNFLNRTNNVKILNCFLDRNLFCGRPLIYQDFLCDSHTRNRIAQARLNDGLDKAGGYKRLDKV